MRCSLLLVAVLAAALCCADAERQRRRHRRLRTTTTAAPPSDDVIIPAAVADKTDVADKSDAVDKTDADDDGADTGEAERAEQLAGQLAERDAAAVRELLDEQRYQEAQRARANEISEHEDGDNNYSDDPCLRVHCSAGRVCEIDASGEAACKCIAQCASETDHRRNVCTNHNETWASDCEVYRQRCLCLEGSELCRGPQYHHVQIEYYGVCREMPACQEDEMADFPRRMRDWLFNIMRDGALRSELSAHYLALEREAETVEARRWANAAVWKWCDLDAHDNDRFVSRHELFPIRAPLMSLEHCIAPFLDACDADHDHRISLQEWGRCLQLDESELEERCDVFTEGEDA